MRDALSVFGLALLMILLLVAGFGCTAFLRDNGITSCEDRGGTPVVSSWFSEDAWDVKCIEQ